MAYILVRVPMSRTDRKLMQNYVMVDNVKSTSVTKAFHFMPQLTNVIQGYEVAWLCNNG